MAAGQPLLQPQSLLPVTGRRPHPQPLGPVPLPQLLEVNSQQRLVTGAQDGSVGVWSLPSGSGTSAPPGAPAQPAAPCSHMLPGMGAPVSLLAEGNEDWLLAGAGNSGCRLYDAASLVAPAGEPAVVAAQQPRARAGCMAWDGAALHLYTGGADGSLSIWDCSAAE
jgi:WD40 repeat protein